MDLLDYYAAGWPYLFIGLCELIIISYIYGIETFCEDLFHMVKFRPGLWLKTHFNLLYMTVSPLIILVSSTSLFILSCYEAPSQEYTLTSSQRDVTVVGYGDSLTVDSIVRV